MCQKGKVIRNRIEKVSTEEFKLLCFLRNKHRRMVNRFEIVINNSTGRIHCKEIRRIDKVKKIV